jgi:hypothetical protein
MPTERKFLVLILDWDESQTESLKLIELARKSHAVLMCFHHTSPIGCNLLMFPLWLLWTSISLFGWNMEMAPTASRTRCNQEASGQTLWCSVHERCLYRNSC